MARIIIVDDEVAMAEVIATLCRDRGHQPFPFSSSEAALAALGRLKPNLLIVDVKMEKVSGFDLLRECREKYPQTAVVMITGYATVETAVGAMKMGAHDYLTKPFKIEALDACIQSALDYQAAQKVTSDIKRELRERYNFENLVGTSAKMQEIYNLIGKVADTDSTILIEGPSGSGKELVARALHYNGSRQNHPFVRINCSAMPQNLLESELFGYKKGAFPGAMVDKASLFEEASEGTLFLDEINSMALQLQSRLLRILQERQIRRIGDTRVIPVNVRVIAASNEPLKSKIKTGTFREDLFYRLAVIPIDIPALRDRLEDVPLLVNYFLQKFASQTATEQKTVQPRAMECLMHYLWPGNVRELENAIERACTLSEDREIKPSDLPPHIATDSDFRESNSGPEWQMGQHLHEFVRDQERKYIEMTLRFNQGSREKTASMLGISIATLYRKLDLKHRYY